MTWYHVVLGASVAFVVYSTLQLTGLDRAAWASGPRRLTYIAVGVLGLVLVGNFAIGDGSAAISAMAVGWIIGFGAGSLKYATASKRPTSSDHSQT